MENNIVNEIFKAWNFGKYLSKKDEKFLHDFISKCEFWVNENNVNNINIYGDDYFFASFIGNKSPKKISKFFKDKFVSMDKIDEEINTVPLNNTLFKNDIDAYWDNNKFVIGNGAGYYIVVNKI